MKRRKFISISSAGIAILSIGAFGLNSAIDQNLILETQSLESIWNHASLVRIGNLYRNQFPDENYSKCLVHGIPDQFINSEELTKYFKKKIIDEHKTSDTVLIDGWLISKTEGRKCALVSIKYS